LASPLAEDENEKEMKTAILLRNKTRKFAYRIQMQVLMKQTLIIQSKSFTGASL
jgi:hypothetical protein